MCSVLAWSITITAGKQTRLAKLAITIIQHVASEMPEEGPGAAHSMKEHYSTPCL